MVNLEREARWQEGEASYRLLPDWNIIPIDCGALIIGEGAAHCVTLNLQGWPTELKTSSAPKQ